MAGFLSFLLISLGIMVFLESGVKDKYFHDDIRSHYFRILKSIFNILVIVFILHYRVNILAINGLGNILIIACIIGLIINIVQVIVNIRFLKRENAL